MCDDFETCDTFMKNKVFAFHEDGRGKWNQVKTLTSA
jgi:hypothetical protein